MSIPSLSIAIPMNPKAEYFVQLHYLLESARLSGGEIVSNAKIIVYLGSDEPPRDLSEEVPWAKDYDIVWHWIDQEQFKRDDFIATAYLRFFYPFKTDMVLMLDVDMIFTGSYDSLICHAWESNLFMGLTAPRCPFHKLPNMSNREWWQAIFREAGLTDPSFCYQHLYWEPGRDEPTQRAAPPGYVNYGMMLGSRKIINTISETYVIDLQHVMRVANINTKCQVAIAVSIQRHDLDWYEVDLKHHFPATNLSIASWLDNFTSDWLAQVRLWHIIGYNKIDISKDRDMISYQAVETMLSKTFSDTVSIALQGNIAQIHKSLRYNYPWLFGIEEEKESE